MDVFLAGVVDVDVLLQDFARGDDEGGAEKKITGTAPEGDDGGFVVFF